MDERKIFHSSHPVQDGWHVLLNRKIVLRSLLWADLKFGRVKRLRLLFAGAAIVIALMSSVSSVVPTAKAADASAVLIDTFDSPLYIASAPGQPRLLFVVEQTGRIQVLRDEVPLGHPFLNISRLVSTGSERGLLSVAFPPNYGTSGRFYVAFTNSTGALEVDEYKRRVGDPTRADPSTRRIVLTVPHPGAENHNGGQLQFGPGDGYLYISTGDGGNLSPPGEPARDLTDLRGKILRINPLPAGTKPYRIPRSNPFVGRPGRDEIFTYGLRNPWRFAFDGRRLIVADVGQTRREEVNFLRKQDASGVNFGWPQYEGNLVFDDTRPGPHPATFPIFNYSHDGGRCAIIGGYVVHDPNLPSLRNRYVYGDLCTGVVRSFVAHVADQRVVGDRPTGVLLPRLSGFGVGPKGQIYLAQITGNISRLAPP